MPRLAVVAIGVVLAVAGLVGLVLFLGGRDDSQLSAAPSGPGELQPDLGRAHDRSATAEGTPTSGPHRPETVRRDRRPLTNDQLLHALELGNVVILYDRLDPALERLQEEVAGPFDPELAAAGQAVILAPREGAGPATALAWRRVLQVTDPADPQLREFAEAWLGLRP